MERNDVFNLILAELDRQQAKWGPQDHPNGTGGPWQKLGLKNWRHTIKAVEAAGAITWRDILHEEVLEAHAESDPDALETELVQVAAVAVQWILAQRRARRKAGRK